MLYTVKPGDTVPDLARRFNLPEAQIEKAAQASGDGKLQAGLLIRLSDELQLQTKASSQSPDPSSTSQLESTVSKAQEALQAQASTSLWSESVELAGATWRDDVEVPNYGSVYNPSTTPTGAPEAPKKSWWDQLIDGAEAKVDESAKKVEKATGNNPLVKLFTGFGRFQTQVLGGALKAVGDMVGGVVNAVAHPIQTLKGLWGLAAHIPFSPPNLIHVGMQVMQGKGFSEILDEEKRYMTGVWNGLTAGYQTAIKEGKWGEIPGRLLVDVGSLLIGAGEANATAKGISSAGKAAGLVDDVAKVASVADDVAKVAAVADDVAKVSRLQTALNAATTAVKGSRVAGVATKAAAAAHKVIDLLGDVGKAAMTAAKNNKLGAAAVAQAEQLGTKVMAIAEKAKGLQGVEKATQLYAKLADEALLAAREARALGSTLKDASYAQIAIELETRAGQMRLAATAASTGIPLNGLDGGVSAFGDR
ncbi:hypothetical protein D3C87_791800 [compost metagenome]